MLAFVHNQKFLKVFMLICFGMLIVIHGIFGGLANQPEPDSRDTSYHATFLNNVMLFTFILIFFVSPAIALLGLIVLLILAFARKSAETGQRKYAVERVFMGLACLAAIPISLSPFFGGHLKPEALTITLLIAFDLILGIGVWRLMRDNRNPIPSILD